MTRSKQIVDCIERWWKEGRRTRTRSSEVGAGRSATRRGSARTPGASCPTTNSTNAPRAARERSPLRAVPGS